MKVAALTNKSSEMFPHAFRSTQQNFSWNFKHTVDVSELFECVEVFFEKSQTLILFLHKRVG